MLWVVCLLNVSDIETIRKPAPAYEHTIMYHDTAGISGVTAASLVLSCGTCQSHLARTQLQLALCLAWHTGIDLTVSLKS